MAIANLTYLIELKEKVEHDDFEEVQHREHEVQGFIDAHFKDPTIPMKIWSGCVNCAKVKDSINMAINWNTLMGLAITH